MGSTRWLFVVQCLIETGFGLANLIGGYVGGSRGLVLFPPLVTTPWVDDSDSLTLVASEWFSYAIISLGVASLCVAKGSIDAQR